MKKLNNMAIRRSIKRKKYKQIWREAKEIGLETKGFEHRNHRTKIKKCGLTPKKQILEKLKNEEWQNIKAKINIITDEE